MEFILELQRIFQRQYLIDNMETDVLENLKEGDMAYTYVCQDLFPACNGRTKNGFRMNTLLKKQLDYLLKNIRRDWDFTLIISGEGEVRVGKSMIAQQIAMYWVNQLKVLYNIDIPFSVKENVIFNGEELISKGNYLGNKYPHSVLIFDEAGADLESSKTLKGTTQAVKDFLRECGQYNMLNILVLPEFFDLPKAIATNRSIALVNVYWVPDADGIFQRGFFKFYSRRGKKILYLRGKKELDYDAWKPDFMGTFPNFYTLDEIDYKNAKRDALKSRERVNAKERKYTEVLYCALELIKDKMHMGSELLAKELNKRLMNFRISKGFIINFNSLMKSRLGLEQVNENPAQDLIFDDVKEVDKVEDLDEENEKDN